MRSAFEFISLIAACAMLSFAATPGVIKVVNSTSDRSLTAASERGRTDLAAREIRVDLQFPSSRSEHGQLHMLFEPSTGLLMRNYGWGRSQYQVGAWFDLIESRGLVGVAAGRMIIAFPGQYGLTVLESSEKAVSLDDAEAKSLKWMSDHLAEVEARTLNAPQVVQIPLERQSLLDDFFIRPEGEPDAKPYFLPIKLMDMERQERAWDISIQSMETKRTCNVLLFEPGAKGMNSWTVEYVTTKPEKKD